MDKLDLLRRSGTTGGPLLLSDGWVINPGDVLDPSRVFRDGMVHFPRAGYSPDMHRNGSLAGRKVTVHLTSTKQEREEK